MKNRKEDEGCKYFSIKEARLLLLSQAAKPKGTDDKPEQEQPASDTK